jgi:hypothetical protein
MRWPMRRALCSRSDMWPRSSNTKARCSSLRREPCVPPPKPLGGAIFSSNASPMPTASSLCTASVSAFTFFLAPVACKSPGQGISSTMQPGKSSSLAEMHMVPSLLDVSMARGFSTHGRSPIDRSSSTTQIGNRFAVSASFLSLCVKAMSALLQPTPCSAIVSSNALLSARAFFLRMEDAKARARSSCSFRRLCALCASHAEPRRGLPRFLAIVPKQMPIDCRAKLKVQDESGCRCGAQANRLCRGTQRNHQPWKFFSEYREKVVNNQSIAAAGAFPLCSGSKENS